MLRATQRGASARTLDAVISYAACFYADDMPPMLVFRHISY